MCSFLTEKKGQIVYHHNALFFYMIRGLAEADESFDSWLICLT